MAHLKLAGPWYGGHMDDRTIRRRQVAGEDVDVDDRDEPEPRANPGHWYKGMPSANPAGRPRKGNSLAEYIQQRLPPEVIVDGMLAIIHDPRTDARTKLTGWKLLADRGYQRPALRVELGGSSAGSTLDMSSMSLDQLRQLAALDLTDEQRAAVDELEQRNPGAVEIH